MVEKWQLIISSNIHPCIAFWVLKIIDLIQYLNICFGEQRVVFTIIRMMNVVWLQRTINAIATY
jgi:hypothetical protein